MKQWNQEVQLAGYLSDLCRTTINEYAGGDRGRLQHWAKALCAYELSGEEFPSELPQPPSGLAVLCNQLQRGTPTRPTPFLEDWLVANYGIATRDADTRMGELSYKPGDNLVNTLQTDFEPFKQAFIPCDSAFHPAGLEADVLKALSFDSEWERQFYLKTLPAKLGSATFFAFEPQAPFQNRIRHGEQDRSFEGQRIDFLYSFPQKEQIDGHNYEGIIIELDGPHHREDAQRMLDQQRDAVATRGNYWTIRLRYDEQKKNDQKLVELDTALNNLHCWQALQNQFQGHEEPHGAMVEAFRQVLYIPYAVARIQRTILQILMAYPLLRERTFNLAVLERDVPCAKLAVQDLIHTAEHLKCLMGVDTVLPPIELDVYRLDNQKDTSLSLSTFPTETSYDAVLDHSILYRPNLPVFHAPQQPLVVGIRTSFAAGDSLRKERAESAGDTPPMQLSAPLIQYQPLGTYKAADQESATTFMPSLSKTESLQYFLQYLFRKLDFRTGQLEILNRALQRKDVIGLLPTGGGKSLTYQLAALLQPGITLVIDPIRSLMWDQYSNLRKNAISAGAFINSSQKPEVKREKQNQLLEGRLQFFFIAPERLQMSNFQRYLHQLNDDGRYFAYAVIDEAHCVSEWGHDFRTSYLRLGDNLRNLLATQGNGEYVSLFGLTATASFDVLADVQRELAGRDGRVDENAVVNPPDESTQRKELRYKVIEIGESPSSPPDYSEGYSDQWEAKKSLSNKKDEALKEIIQGMGSALKTEQVRETTLPEVKFESDYDFEKFWRRDCENAMLIFMPHGGWIMGVTDRFKESSDKNGLFDRISTIVQDKDTDIIPAGYRGSGTVQNRQQDVDDWALKGQQKFVRNQANLMIATKAFGMGIDKPNIRSTVHYSFPSSIEGFVQEAGRAARDRRLGVCYLLFSREGYWEDKTVTNTQSDGSEVQETQPEFHEVDWNVQQYFHDNNFKGEDYEVEVIRCLMTRYGVERPEFMSHLESVVKDCLEDEEFSLGLFNKSNKFRLYLNHPEIKDSYKIFIDLKNNPYEIKEQGGRNDRSDEFRAALKEVIKAIRNQEIDDNSQLSDKLLLQWESGLLQKLQRVDVRQTVKAVLPFQPMIARQDMGPAMAEKFNNTDKDKNGSQQADQKKMPRLGEQDTFRAVYRLSLLGVVADYEVDYSKRMITLKLQRLGLQTQWEEKYRGKRDRYINYVYNYLARYENERRVIQQLNEEIDGPITDADSKSDGNFAFLYRMIRFMIHYAYTQVVAKRKRAIADMHSACIEATQNGDVAFAEFIDLYFNSKYARMGYQVNGEPYSLYEDTEQGRTFDISLLEKYVAVLEEDSSGSFIDNAKHLRGACLRLLRDNPDNPILHLLLAFTLYVLTLSSEGGAYTEEKKTARQSTLGGLRLLQQNDVLQFDDLLYIEATFSQALKNQVSTTANTQYVDSLLSELEDLFWLEYFNQSLETILPKFHQILTTPQ